ncbi:uncharacterized protein DUF1998 [Branchiibius hedensis]|uniref:MrfA-like Zn-binding domain-containing protein n=1 Tax=Branchiibius hedensis TaxID=672460 RepID=A0A2Y8ZSE5_9MICO|nr:DUF1998 domain-containing protein [Branchiibius hedensis]PWJ26062.1 uncharacterized protein DUF1998 [Branchiibius hedensis]SSA34874.1 protein of unknown function [Branchiibius hedensis]
MERIKHDLRLSETVIPFGVGAIVDIRGASLIAPDTSWWDRKYAAEIKCERLVDRLGPSVLLEAPTHAGRAGEATKGLLYWRFPEWRFCERCTRLSRKTAKDKGKWANVCANCKGALVPMRYVAVCERGSHIQDIPWFQWAHRGHDSGVTETVRHCRAYKELRFVRTATHGEGLKSLRVTCGGCGRSRPLSDLVATESLKRDGVRCEGRQPWEDEKDGDPCEHNLVAVQRGATGNYIAERISALDIPEDKPRSISGTDAIRGHMFFEKVVADNGGPQAEMVAGWIANELGVTPDKVLAVAAADDDVDDAVLLNLKDGEWAAFLNKLDKHARDTSEGDFVVDGWRIDQSEGTSQAVADLIAGIGQVRRVREVRALRGFRRRSADASMVSADLGFDARRQPAYPAIEMYGEGIFIRFNEERISEWESQPAVQARARLLTERRTVTPWAHRLDLPEPRFIALHTVAHLLIRRLAFASGYSSASLQERIYSNSDRVDRTAGVLIYTAAGDAQGTLGGLVRLGQPEKLVPLLTAALDDADYCSNDPVCIESDRQGTGSLNLSACHGCALISETSCETSNRLLDRQLVLGGRNVQGLFEGVLKQARAEIRIR